MFNKFKSLDAAFQQVRWLSLGSLLLSALVSIWSVHAGLAAAAKAEEYGRARREEEAQA